MSKVIYNSSVSLDGFVAGPNDRPENGLGDGGDALFAWCSGGDVAVPLPGNDRVFRVSLASAELLRRQWSAVGAMVAGRRMFDIARAWGGRPPLGVPCFVVTHRPPPEWSGAGSPFTFVTDGVESAVAQARAAAGDRDVAVATASVLQQALRAGLIDEIHLDVAPVLLGAGVSLFGHSGTGATALERLHVIEGQGVTHVAYRVLREG